MAKSVIRLLWYCRKLTLETEVPLRLPHLELDSFSWTIVSKAHELVSEDVAFLASLTTLTSLELCNVQTADDVMPLQQLTGLRELSLKYCNCRLPGAVLGDETFQALEKLHIEENYCNGLEDPSSSDDEDDREGQSRKDEEDIFERLGRSHLKMTMAFTADAVLSLPKLRQLSGESTLYNLGMLKRLKDWHVAKDQYNEFAKVWTKC